MPPTQFRALLIHIASLSDLEAEKVVFVEPQADQLTTYLVLSSILLGIAGLELLVCLFFCIRFKFCKKIGKVLFRRSTPRHYYSSNAGSPFSTPSASTATATRASLYTAGEDSGNNTFDGGKNPNPLSSPPSSGLEFTIRRKDSRVEIDAASTEEPPSHLHSQHAHSPVSRPDALCEGLRNATTGHTAESALQGLLELEEPIPKGRVISAAQHFM